MNSYETIQKIQTAKIRLLIGETEIATGFIQTLNCTQDMFKDKLLRDSAELSVCWDKQYPRLDLFTGRIMQIPRNPNIIAVPMEKLLDAVNKPAKLELPQDPYYR